ncbi:ArsR/SmtB family transcription factor [Aeromicrobium terrae]|uniref:Helix-turn-helix transcriptional regulator n=1 Tax=Aeromicrobium terrae TaxID=2498846 RepID=A0A5C8NLZ8_9ACTN|nr:metalloregulator ArsR/SmtB family transcription factor [Aeromicrobium terrae]TXL62166.1 helix-turn-helix transcriptional regulator [Aeromicrobium terrae]
MPTELPVLDTAVAGCCSPITGGVMNDSEATSLAAKFKAMGDPTRLRLLSLVAASEGGEACVCDLNDQLDLSQPTVSHHLKLLVDAGLLTRSKRGVWSYYALVPGALPALADTLQV